MRFVCFKLIAECALEKEVTDLEGILVCVRKGQQSAIIFRNLQPKFTFSNICDNKDLRVQTGRHGYFQGLMCVMNLC